MEIIDYLRILRKRALVLVLVPLIAVIAAVAWALLKPPSYAAVATVNGTALVNTATSQFTGPQGVSQFVAAFDAAATGPYVLNVVGDRTSVPVRDLRDGLLVTQVGDSSTMRVAFEGPKRETIDPVLSTTVQETLNVLFKPRADQAVRDRDAAAQQVEAANAEAEAFAEKQGRADPNETYQALVGQISNLEQQQATLRANGNAVSAAALDAPLKSARARAAEYGPILAEFATVQAKQRAASDALASAQQDYRLATGALTATSADRVVYVSGVSSAAAANDAWSLVVPVLGAGIFTAFVLVFALELLSRSRAQGRRDLRADGTDGPGDSEADGVPGDEHGVDHIAPPQPVSDRDPAGAPPAVDGRPERPSAPVGADAGLHTEHDQVQPEEDERVDGGQRSLVESARNAFGMTQARQGEAEASRQPRGR